MPLGLPLVPAYLRIGMLFSDTAADTDRDPDLIWADEGIAQLEPVIGNLVVVDDDGRKAVLANAVKAGSIKTGGRIAWDADAADPDNNLLVVDLTSEMLEDRVTNPEGRTHTLVLRNVKADGTTLYSNSRFPVRIAADMIDGSGVVNLASQIPTVAEAPIVVDLRKGDTGTSVTGVDPTAAAAGDLVLLLSDGEETDPIPLPPGPAGPGGDDAGVASYIATPGSDTQTALNAQTAQGIADDESFTGSPAEAVAAVAAPRATRAGYVPRVGAPIARRLKDQSQATIIAMVGDSTADQADEWFELLIAWLGSQAPTAMPAKAMRFSDAAQGYTLPSIIKAGTPASVAFTGAHYITTPDSATVSLAGDMTAVVDLSLADWTPGGNNPALLTKFGLDGNRSFRFYVEQTTGLLCLAWTPTGLSSGMVVAKSSVAPSVADGARLRVAAELDVDNGAGGWSVRFYTAAGGTSAFAQLGSTQSGAGVTSVFDSTIALSIGARLDNSVDNWTGTLYAAHLLAGTLAGGKVVAGYDPCLYPAQQGNQALVGLVGETWSPVGTPAITYSPMLLAYNGSVATKTLAYSSTRLAIQTPVEPHLFYISYGHNQTGSALTEWDQYATDFRARWPRTPIVAVAQSPQKAPRLATQIARQAQIAAEVQQIATLRGYALLNAFEVLSENVAAYVQSDGMHTTTAGSATWADEAKEAFLPWPAA